VEDDAGARESIKLLLTIDRHEVTEAQNGREGIALFCQYVFDLVIIDFFMPQMQGKELASHLKCMSATVPILMVTAYAEKLVDMDIQVDGILAKPFGIAELRQAIAKLVTNRSTGQSRGFVPRPEHVIKARQDARSSHGRS